MLNLVERWSSLVSQYHAIVEIPYNVSITLGQIEQESGGNPDVIGKLDNLGSVGLLQIVPQYNFSRFFVSSADLFAALLHIPSYNVFCGLTIMNDCLTEQQGDIARALGQYNSGNPAAPNMNYAYSVLQKAAYY